MLSVWRSRHLVHSALSIRLPPQSQCQSVSQCAINKNRFRHSSIFPFMIYRLIWLKTCFTALKRSECPSVFGVSAIKREAPADLSVVSQPGLDKILSKSFHVPPVWDSKSWLAVIRWFSKWGSFTISSLMPVIQTARQYFFSSKTFTVNVVTRWNWSIVKCLFRSPPIHWKF